MKCFSCSACDKNWKHSVKSCYQQISNLYKLCFSSCNYSFANKVDILHEEKTPVDLKLQHKINRNNSFSRYLENAPTRVNATIFVWCYLSSRLEVFCKKAVFINFPKVTGKYLCGSVFLKNLQVWDLQFY